MSNESASAPPVTLGRRHGLGSALPQPREHCNRCKEITERASQMAMNYIMANARQVAIINRLLKDSSATKLLVAQGELLAEMDSLLDTIYTHAHVSAPVRVLIEAYRAEVEESDRAADTTEATNSTEAE